MEPSDTETSPASTIVEEKTNLVAPLEARIKELELENRMLHGIFDQENLSNGVAEMIFPPRTPIDEPLADRARNLLEVVSDPLNASEELKKEFNEFDCRFLMVNPATALSWGKSTEEVKGMSLNKDMAPHLPPSVTLEWKRAGLQAIVTGDTVFSEYERFNPVRKKHVFLQGTMKCLEPMTDPPMIAFSYTNVSEMQSTLDNLKNKEKQTESTLRSKTRLLAHASHELRNPLNGILGLTKSMLEEATNLTQDQLHNLHVIDSCGEELLRHVEHLLLMSKIESNMLPVAQNPVDIRALVQDVVEMIQARRKLDDRKRGFSNTLEIISDVDQSVPLQIVGDAGHITSVLGNLLSNAVKATSNGKVWVSVIRSQAVLPSTPANEESTFQLAPVSPAKPGRARIPKSPDFRGQTLGDEDWLEFRVRDQGPGIPAEHLGSLFQPYSQLESTYDKNYKGNGSGLGLSIAKSLCVAMGGRIGAKSQVGKGCEFWFVIPAIPVTQPSLFLSFDDTVETSNVELMALGMVKHTKHFAKDCPFEKILIAEDNEINVKVLKVFLKQLGYEQGIQVAENGQQALDILKSNDDFNAYPILISDVSMPIMSGRELFRRIRRELSNQPLIIALSASAMEEDRRKALRAGADIFLMKPLRKEALCGALESCWKKLQRRGSITPSSGTSFASSGSHSLESSELSGISNL